MRRRFPFRAVGIVAVVLAATLCLFAQQPAARPAPVGQQTASGRGGKAKGTAFPAHPPASPEEIAGGKQLFEANCSFCHGSDARGGETGPNLVRAQVVLDDQHGELIAPIVHSGFPAQGMPKFNLSDAEITAIAAFLHSLPMSNRGAPTNLDILVGNAQAGRTYFNAHCTSCHSVTGTGAGSLAGIGGKYDAKVIQNMIVSGHGSGLRHGQATHPAGPPTTVTVTLASGQTVDGKLDRISAFAVSLTEADGTHRSFARNGAVPKVAIHDPLQWHIDMLPKWSDTDIHNLTAYLATLKH